MGARKHRGIDDWDLWLVVYAIAALSAATDVYGFQRLAPTLGLPAWAGALWVIPIKFVEWKFLTFAMRLFRSGWLGTFVCPAPVVAWCIAFFLSTLAAHSTIYNTLASASRIQAKKAETRANLSAALDAINGQIKSLSVPKAPRPVSVVKEALAWNALPEDVRRITRDCTRFANDGQRDACKETLDFRKELAAAKEYERLSNNSSELRARLEGVEIEAAENPMPRSYEMSLGRFVITDGKDGIAFMGMMLLTLVSGLGPFGLHLLGRAGQTLPPAAGRASLDGESAQSAGQGTQTDRLPTATSAHGQSSHGQSAHQPAHPARPEGQTAQPDGVPPRSMPSNSRGEPAHVPAQATRPADVEAAQDQPARDHPGARPAYPQEPAQSLVGRRSGQAKRPARKRARSAAQRSPTSKVVHLDRHLKALTAVRSFVGMLEQAPSARAAGSALAEAYESLRPVHGWPTLAPNVLGTLLRVAVEEVGGGKLKSGGQIYVGMRIPAEWSMRVAA